MNISLRTLHLIGVAGLGGAWFYQVSEAVWRPYLWLALLSGAVMVALAVWSNGIWLLQLRGQVILFKLMLLGLMLLFPGLSWPLGMTIIVISSVISHAPGNLRYFSPWHRRRIEHF